MFRQSVNAPLLRKRSSSTVFNTNLQLWPSWAKRIPPTDSHPLQLNSTVYVWVFQVVSFRQVFRTKFLGFLLSHACHLPCQSHFHLFKHCFLIVLTRSSNREAPHYVTFSSPLFLSLMSKYSLCMHCQIFRQNSFIQCSVWRQVQSLLQNDASTQYDPELPPSNENILSCP